MEPKDDKDHEFRKIHIQWVQKPEGWPGSNPFSDPEFLRALGQIFDGMNTPDGLPGFEDEHTVVSSAVQAEMDLLEDIDFLVEGESQPVALRMIMDAVSRVRDAGES